MKRKIHQYKKLWHSENTGVFYIEASEERKKHLPVLYHLKMINDRHFHKGYSSLLQFLKYYHSRL